jgi:hypothetical protein
MFGIENDGGISKGIGEPGGKKAADHKKLAYIAIGLGVVGVIIAWLTLRNSSSAGTGVTTTSATGTDGAGSVAGYSADGSDASYLQAILQAVTGLENGITPPAAATTQASTAPVTAGASPSPEAQLQVGSGFWGGPTSTAIQDTQAGSSLFGSFFQWLSPQAAASGSYQQKNLYYEPSIGNFQQVGSTKLAPGTPQFIK